MANAWMKLHTTVCSHNIMSSDSQSPSEDTDGTLDLFVFGDSDVDLGGTSRRRRHLLFISLPVLHKIIEA